MTTGIRSDASGTFGALTFGGDDVLRFGSDNSGALAGFRNILINGDMRINQRGVTIAAAANGAYGPDRWKKVDASNMTQIVEAGNFIPSTIYTLSGTGVTTQQITSPASGNWALPNIPIAATKIQLEEGSIATPFEQRPIGLELSLCQRYYWRGGFGWHGACISSTNGTVSGTFPVPMRVAPTFAGIGGAGGSAIIRTGGEVETITTYVNRNADKNGAWFYFGGGGYTTGVPYTVIKDLFTASAEL